MIAPRNSIFRDKALKHYMQNRKKDVLPNFSSVPTAIFAWLLFVLLLATGLVAAYGQVPVSVTGAGLVLGTENAAQEGSNGAVMLAFFPTSAAAQLHAGQSAKIQVGGSSLELTGVIAQVEPGTSSPAAVLERYGEKTSGPTQAQQQTVVAVLKPGANVQAATYIGSALVVQVNAGTQSLFSAISGL